MTTPSTANRTLTLGRALLFGALTVGTLDILDAFIFFGVRSGAKPVRILQGIAGGVLGPSAPTMGIPAAALGLFLHFFIAFCVAGVYLAVSRRLPTLRRLPFLWGPSYGICVYLVMNWIVIPLSAVGSSRRPSGIGLLNGVLIHILGVGLPSALFARAATSEADRP